jgi:hypothetical protein
VVAVVAADAAMVVAPYRTAPTTPPTSIDPAIAAAAIDFRKPFMTPSPLFVIRSWSSVEANADGGASAGRERSL